MGIEHSLPVANCFAVTCGPIAFPLFGIVAAAAFILSDLMFRKRWIGWALIAAFALLVVWAFRALLIGGVFMGPASRANYRPALAAATTLTLHCEACWHRASEAGYYANT